MLQMFQTILIALALLVGSAVVLVLGRAYYNGTLRWETFQNKVKTVSAQQQVAPAVQPIPAPAPSVQVSPSPEPPREVAAAGPNPPAARAPPAETSISPDAVARDPYEEANSLAPIRDNLRHPENSFGPGVPNTGTDLSVGSGASSDTVRAGISTFSPEFAQNGGEWIKGVMANDLAPGDEFATF